MLLKESYNRASRLKLRHYRIILMLGITLITGCYLWLETGVIPHEQFIADYNTIHWIFAWLIWLTGMTGIQFGYQKLQASANASEGERNNLLAIFNSVQVGMLLIDQQMQVICANQAMLQKFDKTPEDGWGCASNGIMLHCPEARDNLLGMGCGNSDICDVCGLMFALRAALENGSSVTGQESRFLSEYAGVQLDIWILYSVKPLDLDGKRLALLSLMDVTERREADLLLRTQQEQYRALVENMPDLIVRFDREGRRLYVNPAYRRLIANDANGLIGKTAEEAPVLGPVISSRIHLAVRKVVATAVPLELELSLELNGDRSLQHYLTTFVPEFNEQGSVASVLSISRDISDLRRSQHELHAMAFYDTLTGLPNRVLFNERLHQQIVEQRRSRQTETIGLLFLDLDGFKAVNDTLGHAVGDQLLQECGTRIRDCLRDQDTVARLGGDEFAVILSEVRLEIDLATIARKILKAVEHPFTIDGKELFVSTSIGIACWPTDSVDPDELIRFADVAMYHAKSQGRNNYQFYSEEMTQHALERMELEGDLRKALQRGELELYYQPKVDTLIGMLVGAEALVRWNHPGQGLIPPDRFIGIAEDTGLIVDIGAWVLQTACRTATAWNRNALFPVKVAVNLSVRQFMSGNLVETVQTALQESGCKPEWMELEITESLLITNKPEVTETLETLHRLGITIAIDDFGTGYSALSYLIDFPVSIVKIDKAFVRDITESKKNLALVKTIISMGQALGLELVAEGVETGQQAAQLDKLGCHIIQGYFYGKPMPFEQFERWRIDFALSRQLDAGETAGLLHSSWRDYLTTGHALIDSQHRELFRRITTLTLASRAGKAQDEVIELLEYLDGYIKTHFAAEEELMITTGFPHYTQHKAAHDMFCEVIEELRSRFREQGATISLTAETNYLAVEWLTKHICTMDRMLADSMQHQKQEERYALPF